jgi:asparagine N-glycosylation enzyme membrane subunit Stt3
MRLSLRIPLALTIVVVMTGIMASISRAARGKALFPTSYYIIWIVVSVILIGITIWSWQRNEK